MEMMTKYTYRRKAPRVLNPKSETIPDQSISLAEMLKRYVTNQPIDANNGINMYDESELPDLQKMDFQEIHELREDLQNKIKRMQAGLQHAAKVQKEKEDAEREKAATAATKPTGEDGQH